jgi:type IV pilus assembly protein PilB
MTALHPTPGPNGANLADRIGDLLVEEGLITEAQLKAALVEQKATHQRLGYLLVKQGAVSELDLTRVLARQYRMPAVDLARTQIDLKLLPLIPAELAAKRTVLPLRREGRSTRCAG